MTDQEIDKAAEDYVSFEKGGKCYPNYIVERACCRAFKDGANFALGKHDLSNSKGEELLTVPRMKVQRIYAGFKEREAECDTDNCGLSVSDLANVRAFDMFILFGDKCL